jgi:uncharacterized protein YjbJ (UPF0337 family)
MTSGLQASSLIGPRARGIAVAAGAAILLFSLAAAAQETRPAPPARPPAPARTYDPGMLDSVGQWFKDSFNRLGSSVEGARDTFGGLGERASGAAKDAAGVAKGAVQDAAKGTADAAKGAADAVARLPGARVVEGRARCEVADNGAPDCRAAAEAVCRGKGFGSGSSLDIQSTQKCPARVWISGRAPEPGDCEKQSFVTRAMCQ